jgi:dipeptidyl aminopeptidase/acylaminoacyl peptidase
MKMEMQKGNKISEFIATEARERQPRLSPDNKWVAYQSDESGKYEIYVTTFPEKGARWQISSNGGLDPLWSPDGDRIFYRNKNEVLSVEIYDREEFRTGKPIVLFSGKFRQATLMGWYYDIHPDGDKFVMVKGGEIDTTQNKINIIKNFDKEIERKFAAAR